MTKAFAVLPLTVAARIHHQPTNLEAAGALILIGAGALALAIVARRREHHWYAQGYIDGIEYRHLSGTTHSRDEPPPAA